MTLFGFVVGTTLINTLFLFDVYVTKYSQRMSLWGSTMAVVLQQSGLFKLVPIITLLNLWVIGMLFSDGITFVQFIVSIAFWCWFMLLYVSSTFMYYKWGIDKIPNPNKK
ncbi:hypothetical protein pEaSNUABM49_00561 [Erwinia phage pEa_SNUABM_49]|nr:hypothetical protein pEaSNUABM44_00559 [Erwinia phage pEa_SNUABM_44]QXO12774.1 hypothetical protein pEaSNUABM49_00561 [Erwinia phage pEa_SNUABM_49]